MKRLLLSLMAALAGLVTSADAAISVGAGGSSTYTFTAIPPAGEFASTQFIGDGATFSTLAQVDARVATATAASITTALGTSGTEPPSANALGFRQHSVRQVLMSQPTTGTAPQNCAAVVMLATLQNTSGNAFPSISVSYDFATQTPLAGELPGHQVYYSLSGLASSWVPIPSLSNTEAAVYFSATLTFGTPWANSATMYLLWVDDNANSITDPSYTIDNFRVQIATGPIVITTQPVGGTFTEGDLVTLSVAVTGASPQYQWYKEGVGAIPGATGSTYTLSSGSALPSDSGVYYVVVNNSIPSSAESTHVTVLVNPDTTTPIPFTSTATLITFDTAPIKRQWSTRDFGGVTADLSTFALLDAAAKTNDANLINQALTTALSTATARVGQYASDTTNIQTHPTGAAYTGFMATLTNDTGTNVLGLTLAYNLTIAGAGAAYTEEAAFGHVVYYSLSGAPGSWVEIPGLAETSGWRQGTFSKSGDIDLTSTPWSANAKMYFLWVDDNASTNPTSGTEDANQIDNVTWTLLGPPQILDQSSMTNRNVLQCRSTTMTVVASGGTNRWFRNGVQIPVYGSTYTITNMTQFNDGEYFVNVINSREEEINSQTVTITFVPDTAPPTLLLAIAGTNLAQVTLTFDESVDTNNLAALASSFVLTDTTASSAVTILSVSAPNATTLVLNTVPFTANHSLSIQLNGLADSCAGNLVGSTSHPVYSIRSTLVAMNAPWRYDDFTDTNPIPSNWAQLGFNNLAINGTAWKSGIGPFDASRGGAGTAGGNCRDTTTNHALGVIWTCLNLTSPLTGTNFVTANFRTQFTFTGNPSATILQFSGKFDDGAIVYLNGTELERVRMPAQPAVITRSTFAIGTAVGGADPRDTAQFISPPALLSGDNVLAVELHQQSATSSDLTMALEVTAFTTAPITVAQPLLAISRSGANVNFSWTVPGGILQFKNNLESATWTNVTNSNPFPIDQAHRFYRLVVP